ncbi:hypothetical protein [Psittacicella hinzii]|uniref:Uncharacterized protein n=1 Tax=Psittacicella hinzii TaxID=2028575 RepID=A0A3A1YIQ1_9GAMM|nr:hypothetical protein [Psittacicella hinzii]RIY37471.1 hypothetical protein CKF58_04945 [Psittacicella hinzii]
MKATIDFNSCTEILKYYSINQTNFVKLFSRYHKYNLQIEAPSEALIHALIAAIKVVVTEYEDSPDQFWLYEQKQKLADLIKTEEAQDYLNSHLFKLYFCIEYLIANCKDDNFRKYFFN